MSMFVTNTQSRNKGWLKTVCFAIKGEIKYITLIRFLHGIFFVTYTKTYIHSIKIQMRSSMFKKHEKIVHVFKIEPLRRWTYKHMSRFIFALKVSLHIFFLGQHNGVTSLQFPLLNSGHVIKYPILMKKTINL